MSIDVRGDLLALGRLLQARAQFVDDIGYCLDGQDQPRRDLLLIGFSFIGDSHDDAGASPRDADPSNTSHVNVGYGYALDERSPVKRSHDYAPDLRFPPPSEIQSVVAGGDNLSHARSGIKWGGTFWTRSKKVRGGKVRSAVAFKSAPASVSTWSDTFRLICMPTKRPAPVSIPLSASRVARERAARRVSLCTGRAA